MQRFRPILLTACLALPGAAQAVVLVTTDDGGWYNNSIGTVLNGTNGGETGPFPVSNDGTFTFTTEPDLSAADAALGDWLTNPFDLNANWTFLDDIPNSWTAGDEVAVIYQFDTLGATNVRARFGVDNGLFAWLDGEYVFGARAAGGVSLGEYELDLGDLAAGTYFLQLLLEDHGSASGYAVEITADTFVPGPEVRPGAVPEPAGLALVGLALAGLSARRRR